MGPNRRPLEVLRLAAVAHPRLAEEVRPRMLHPLLRSPLRMMFSVHLHVSRLGWYVVDAVSWLASRQSC